MYLYENVLHALYSYALKRFNVNKKLYNIICVFEMIKWMEWKSGPKKIQFGASKANDMISRLNVMWCVNTSQAVRSMM